MHKISHLTTVHHRYDTRIFVKECSSLARVKGYEVSLIVADGNDDEVKNGVFIYGIPKQQSRMGRLFVSTQKVFRKALELDSDIYHLHDPELLLAGLRLRKKGKIVIFDVHENIVEQIKSKTYLPRLLRLLVSKIFLLADNVMQKKMHVVLAESSYKEIYNRCEHLCTTVLNMPQQKLFSQYIRLQRRNCSNEILYVGGISEVRGINEIIQALKILDERSEQVHLKLVGPKHCSYVTPKMKGCSIKEFGFLPIYEAYELSVNCKVGLSILHPIPNYKKSYSTKIFEYMAIGLPVVTSNFQLYRNVVEKFECGFCVDPLNPKEIADAIDYIISNPDEAERMGKNGIKAVREKYNWSQEEKKLLQLYESLTE